MQLAAADIYMIHPNGLIGSISLKEYTINIIVIIITIQYTPYATARSTILDHYRIIK